MLQIDFAGVFSKPSLLPFLVFSVQIYPDIPIQDYMPVQDTCKFQLILKAVWPRQGQICSF